MSRIRYIHWNREEANVRARIFKDAGFEVDCDLPAGSSFLKELEAKRTDAIVIDLSRIPSQGRDLAVAIRRRKGTRHIPIIFVHDEVAKVEKIGEVLPDVASAGWDQIVEAVEEALKRGAEDVVIPESEFAAYAGKPLAEKLGIKAGNRVANVGAPSDLSGSLNGLPAGVKWVAEIDERTDLVLWFVHSVEQLKEELEAIVDAAKGAPVWIAWPKGGSAREGDLTQQVVRETAMKAGLVDYKICSIDSRWSGLLFTWRGDTS